MTTYINLRSNLEYTLQLNETAADMSTLLQFDHMASSE